MPDKILRDKNVFPTPEVMVEALGKRCAAVLAELIETITGDEYGLTFEWRFYNDGKTWLGKAVYKKKTVFWLSVYEDCFRANFYFTEKTRGGVLDLNVDDRIKAGFAAAEMSGKMVQLPLPVSKKSQLKDVLELVRYKKMLK